MAVERTVRKIGGSLMVAIPSDVAGLRGIRDGSVIEYILLSGGGLGIKLTEWTQDRLKNLGDAVKFDIVNYWNNKLPDEEIDKITRLTTFGDITSLEIRGVILELLRDEEISMERGHYIVKNSEKYLDKQIQEDLLTGPVEQYHTYSPKKSQNAKDKGLEGNREGKKAKKNANE